MADIVVTAGAFRAVMNDPEDTVTLDAASGYSAPEAGESVSISADDEVDLSDATMADALYTPLGMVISVTTKPQGGHRVTVLLRGIVEGFTGMTAGDQLFLSATAGALADANPDNGTTLGGYVMGQALNATQAVLTPCPVRHA